MTKKPKTAAELMAGLQQNPQFVARQKLREEQESKRLEELREEQRDLLADLNNLGVSASSVWDLVNSDEKYPAAVPLLVRHLSLPYNRPVKEGIIRALTVEYAGPAALRELLKEYQKQNDDSETSLKWVLGNAIATVAESSDADTLISLATDPSHGKARDMIISALPRVVRDQDQLDSILRRLMHDDEVREFAHRANLDRSRR
jgi:hypothetical protein